MTHIKRIAGNLMVYLALIISPITWAFSNKSYFDEVIDTLNELEHLTK